MTALGIAGCILLACCLYKIIREGEPAMATNNAEPGDGCICAPGTCPEWEAKAGLLVDDPDCDYHGGSR